MANPVTKLINSSYVEVQEGQDLNLTCIVTGISCLDPVYWDTGYLYHDYGYCNGSVCLSSTVISLQNVSSNDTGTYTCKVASVMPRIPPKNITVVVVPGNGRFMQ